MEDREIWAQDARVLADIGLAKTFNPNSSCVQTFEENDPTAIFQVVPQSGSTVTVANAFKDAIEPMSGGRLNLFLGQEESTTNEDAQGIGQPSANKLGPYFIDPTCPVETTATRPPITR